MREDTAPTYNVNYFAVSRLTSLSFGPFSTAQRELNSQNGQWTWFNHALLHFIKITEKKKTCVKGVREEIKTIIQEGKGQDGCVSESGLQWGIISCADTASSIISSPAREAKKDRTVTLQSFMLSHNSVWKTDGTCLTIYCGLYL